MRIFHGVTTDFRKTIIWKKVTSITKSPEFSRIFWSYIKYLMIASYKWWKIHTVILRECYHDTMRILLYYGNIMNMFQQKSLKLQCKKNNQWEGRNDKTPFLKGFSDLRLLINTYEGLSFQWPCRQDHATHRNMKSLGLIYIFEEY